MIAKNLNIDDTPLVVCGDFNFKPDSAGAHILFDRQYQLTEEWIQSEDGQKAYGGENGKKNIDIFNQIQEDIQNNIALYDKIKGKLHSAYASFS